MTEQPEAEAFYTELFTKSAGWSTTYPNAEEARRAARILPLLSQVAEEHRARDARPLQILDLGCGRGWLTYIADMYGECLGVDPVKAVIDFAKTRYPHLSLKVGTAEDLLRDGHGGRFDVVIEIPPPDRALRAEFLSRALPQTPPATIDALASRTDSLSFAHLQEILRLSGLSAIHAQRSQRSEKDLLDAVESVRESHDQAVRGFPEKPELPFGLLPLRNRR